MSRPYQNRETILYRGVVEIPRWDWRPRHGDTMASRREMARWHDSLKKRGRPMGVRSRAIWNDFWDVHTTKPHGLIRHDGLGTRSRLFWRSHERVHASTGGRR